MWGLEMSRDDRAFSHIAHEVHMCAYSAFRMLSSDDENDRVAYLECELLHARALEEFLVVTRRRPRDDDMLRTHFAPEWTPSPDDAVSRLGERRETINKYLAHLTWARVDEPDAPAWSFIEIADDIVAVAAAWVGHVTRSEGRLPDDPDIKALILANAVSDAQRWLGMAPR
ncbi:hypothetical protein [Longivirga aurantiaca]|uniref:Uncharacterized protein n=1 Tax=Longivirga aurantiaca TaxID=1837743 RepID=A0ABW1T035_9ACTN